MLFCSFDHRHERPPLELVDLLGGKGAGLAMMAGELALPVPDGFTLTTLACRDYLERGWTPALDEAVREGLARIESATGKRLGDPRDPLLLSVRSGAPVSMPGMLDTVLDLGLNTLTQAALAQADSAFARDCRERLESSFHASVGEAPPEDLWLQLTKSIAAVFRSAQSPRAVAYRRRERLPEDPRTAVHIQVMAFGNRDADSATGVLFSRDPATGEARLYGDVLFRAQGEDVVSGRHRTASLVTLEQRLPEAARGLREAAGRLEQKLRDLCEIEFTIESGQLWLLQVRVGKRSPRAAIRIAAEMALDPDFPLGRREAVERVRGWLLEPPTIETVSDPTAAACLAEGIGASPGIVSGELAVDLAEAIARSGDGRSVLLARPETSPEDVAGMAAARGLLTARGGLGSHAAVIARGWGIPAVVGLAGLAIDATGIELAGRRFESGQLLSIDGSTGRVYSGEVRVERRVAPEVDRLLDWARELDVDLAWAPEVENGLAEARGGGSPAPRAPRAGVRDAPRLAPSEAVSADAVVRVLSIKGAATRESMAAALGAEPESVDGVIEALMQAGTLTPARPLGVGLSELGRERARALLEADHACLGRSRAGAALEAFQELDRRLKQAVTDWQLRPVAGEQVPNDHTDPVWDEDVFARLGAIVEDVSDWLAPLSQALPRLRRYAERIACAFELARDGDARFVASPRVDSVHGIWFELHEDLIRLADRTREEELAAGRAG
jgi:pyruvate,orthophosphate dikinase